MLIQTERIWLFETSIVDPYFLGEKDGVTIKMLADNPRVIEELDIETVVFYFNEIARAGMKYTQSFGGEDTDISESYGKSSANYSLELTVPTFNQLIIEKLIGKEFSVLGMKRDLSHYLILGRFEASPLNIDNEVQQRVTFKANTGNAKIYDVQSFNVTTILNTVTEETLAGAGFDYNFDFGLN